MDNLLALWLPIVVSAVIVFIASSIIWMATPLHKHDYKNPGDKEGPILDLLRGAGMSPGMYYVPWCQGKNPKDPDVQARMKAGPWAMLTVMPEAPNMGKMLGLWFLHLLITSFLVAYVASHALPAGAQYLKVFQIVGATALIAHAGYALPLSIWHANPWSQLPSRLVDGVVYALLTAGTFGWLWPTVD
jgi:hypothetical protein